MGGRVDDVITDFSVLQCKVKQKGSEGCALATFFLKSNAVCFFSFLPLAFVPFRCSPISPWSRLTTRLPPSATKCPRPWRTAARRWAAPWCRPTPFGWLASRRNPGNRWSVGPTIHSVCERRVRLWNISQGVSAHWPPVRVDSALCGNMSRFSRTSRQGAEPRKASLLHDWWSAERKLWIRVSLTGRHPKVGWRAVVVGLQHCVRDRLGLGL